MPTDEERLVVSLEARIRDFEKNMAKAERTGTQSFQGLRRSSATATRQMEADALRSSTRINQAFATIGTKIGTFGKAFGGGLIGTVAGLGITGIIGGLADVAKGVAEVGDEAKRAGVNVKAFQELKFVAEQNRIGVDALTDGLKEMNLRADEFILTGKGSSAEAFQRLGFDAESLATKLKEPAALFTEIIGKLRQFDKAAQIRIADEIFGGTGGEKFVQLIEQGEDGIRDTIKAANDLGIVMDDQLIERAAELDRRFNALASTVGSALKSAIVSAADSLAEFIDGFRAFQDQQSSTLKGKQADLGMRRVDVETEMSQIKNGEKWFLNPDGPLGKGRLHELQMELCKIATEEAQVVDVLNKRITPMKRSGNDTWTPPVITPSTGGAGRKSGGSSSADREREAVAELIKELEEELRLINATDEAKRAAEATRRAGASATDSEREKVIALTEAIHQEEEARQRVADQMDMYRDITSGALDDIRSALEDGKITFQEWGQIGLNILNKLVDKIQDDFVNALFDAGKASSGFGAGGGGGGIFGAVLGGLGKLLSFDGGGSTGSGARVGGVDGKGGFPAIVHPDETIIDHTKGGGLRAATSQQVHVTSEVKVSIDQNGSLQAYVEKTSQRQVSRAAPELLSAARQQVLPTMANHQAKKVGGDYRNG